MRVYFIQFSYCTCFTPTSIKKNSFSHKISRGNNGLVCQGKRCHITVSWFVSAEKKVPYVIKIQTQKKKRPIRYRIIIDSLPQAYKVNKKMNVDSYQDNSDYRAAERQSLEAILEGLVQERISWYIEEMDRLGHLIVETGIFPLIWSPNSAILSVLLPEPDLWALFVLSRPLPEEPHT